MHIPAVNILGEETAILLLCWFRWLKKSNTNLKEYFITEKGFYSLKNIQVIGQILVLC